jgi:hypothetical protein
LTVSAGTSFGTPPARAAWRATFIPLPACTTLPNTTESTAPGSRPARLIDAAIA